NRCRHHDRWALDRGAHLRQNRPVSARARTKYSHSPLPETVPHRPCLAATGGGHWLPPPTPECCNRSAGNFLLHHPRRRKSSAHPPLWRFAIACSDGTDFRLASTSRVFPHARRTGLSARNRLLIVHATANGGEIATVDEQVMK